MAVNSTEKRWERERKSNMSKFGKAWTDIEIAAQAGTAFGQDVIPPLWAMRWWQAQKKKRINKTRRVTA